MGIYCNEIPKHKKKKQSSVSKIEKKSRHKHVYADCLLICNESPHKARYCTVCGKIKNIKFSITDPVYRNNYTCYRMLTDAEIYEKYKNLPQFEITNLWQDKV